MRSQEDVPYDLHLLSRPPTRARGRVGHSRAIDFQVCVVPDYLGQNTIIAADRVALN